MIQSQNLVLTKDVHTNVHEKQNLALRGTKKHEISLKMWHEEARNQPEDVKGAAPENDTATEDERRAAIMARLDEARAEKARAADLAPDMSKYGTHKKITCDGCAIEVIAFPRHSLSLSVSLSRL